MMSGMAIKSKTEAVRHRTLVSTRPWRRETRCMRMAIGRPDGAARVDGVGGDRVHAELLPKEEGEEAHGHPRAKELEGVGGGDEGGDQPLARAHAA